jgi:hypothetical protein
MNANKSFITKLCKEIEEWSSDPDSISFKQMFLRPFFQKHRILKRHLDQWKMEYPIVEETIFYSEARILQRILISSHNNLNLSNRDKNKWIMLYDDYLREMDLRHKELAARAMPPISLYYQTDYSKEEVSPKFSEIK